MIRRSSDAVVLPALVTFVLLVQACEHSTPPGPGPTPGTSAPVLTGLEIQGNPNLRAIGETSQLRTLARWSDERSTDVTADTVWTIEGSPDAFGSLATLVASVSSSGLLRANQLGMAYVRAAYRIGRAGVRFSVTPEGTFVVAGRVRQPAASSLAGVTVTEPMSGRSTVTGADGVFMLAGLTGTEIRLTREGYEPVLATVAPFDDLLSLPMQPVVQVMAGGSLSGTIAPHDLQYVVLPGAQCTACRMIRVTSAAAGTLIAILKWTESHSKMTLWAGGREFRASSVGPAQIDAEVPIAAGESIIYVGTEVTTYHVEYELSTSFEPLRAHAPTSRR
jgi:hypothetical protein